MSTTITICDESTSGKVMSRFDVTFETETLTVRELIRSRVYQEVKDFNLRQRTGAATSDDRDEFEAQLNGPLETHQADWEHQHQRACEAFERGQVLIIVDDQQQTSLDHQISIGLDSRITFLRLTPLAGG